MRYLHLTAALLVLVLMLTGNAYAATVGSTSPTAENIPEWALRPALEPDEEPASERGYTTIYNADGTLRYSDDPSIIYTVSEDTGEFLSKPFESYSVTEGFLLLFLIGGFCWALWKIIKEVF